MCSSDLYVAMIDEKYAGVGIISLHEEEMYKKASWLNKYDDDEIAVLHLFAIHPSFRNKGVATKFLRSIIEESKKTSKAIHLDVVKGNDAAFHLYEKVGFHGIGEYEVYYEDTGNIIVNLMERDLMKK